MSSKRIEDLHPMIIPLYKEFELQMQKANIPFMVTNTSRSILEQMALYVQGRIKLEDVNRFRLIAGLPTLNNDKDNIVVTWTLDSKHVVNMLDKNLDNDFSKAFDIAILKNGSITYDLKVDINKSLSSDYDEAGIIGERCGLVWGGRFKNSDRPHFQKEV